MTPFLVGIAGGSGSGKSTLCRQLADAIASDTQVLHHDNYYVDRSHLSMDESNRLNFDHPDSLESTLLLEHLHSLRSGRSIEMPIYDFATHSRTEATRSITATSIILVEGILLFAHDELANVFDLRVFVQADDTERLRRRIQRDQAQRGRTRESVVRQWEASVQPMFDRFVLPTQKLAHLVIPLRRPNPEAIETIVRSLRDRLRTSN